MKTKKRIPVIPKIVNKDWPKHGKKSQIKKNKSLKMNLMKKIINRKKNVIPNKKLIKMKFQIIYNKKLFHRKAKEANLKKINKLFRRMKKNNNYSNLYNKKG